MAPALLSLTSYDGGMLLRFPAAAPPHRSAVTPLLRRFSVTPAPALRGEGKGVMMDHRGERWYGGRVSRSTSDRRTIGAATAPIMDPHDLHLTPRQSHKHYHLPRLSDSYNSIPGGLPSRFSTNLPKKIPTASVQGRAMMLADEGQNIYRGSSVPSL